MEEIVPQTAVVSVVLRFSVREKGWTRHRFTATVVELKLFSLFQINWDYVNWFSWPQQMSKSERDYITVLANAGLYFSFCCFCFVFQIFGVTLKEMCCAFQLLLNMWC